jgi:hypothetical protein
LQETQAKTEQFVWATVDVMVLEPLTPPQSQRTQFVSAVVVAVMVLRSLTLLPTPMTED